MRFNWGPRWFNKQSASLRYSHFASDASVTRIEHKTKQKTWTFMMVFWKNKKLQSDKAKSLISKSKSKLEYQIFYCSELLLEETAEPTHSTSCFFLFPYCLQQRSCPSVCNYTFVVNSTNADIMIYRAVLALHSHFVQVFDCRGFNINVQISFPDKWAKY